MAGRFYDEVVSPFLKIPRGIDKTVEGVTKPYRNLLERVEGNYATPGVEPGPRYGVQGPRYQPQNVGGLAENPYIARPETQAAGPMQTEDIPTEEVGGAPEFSAAMESRPESLGAPPPSGDPKKNEYDTMLKDYLIRLRQPADFPQPRPLTRAQMFNMVLHPERAQELREQYQGTDYKQKLMEFQYGEGRQAQAAGLAAQLGQRQEDMQRRDAERSWFRESAMANAGAPLPPGYGWKNPELEAVWNQKKHEKGQADLRTKKYLDTVRSGAQGKPRNRYEHLNNLFTQRKSLEGMMFSPGLMQAQIMSQTGVGDPNAMAMIQGIQDDLARLTDEESVIRAMDDDTYNLYMQADGLRQQQIRQEYKEALASRGGTPGATNQSPSPP